MVNLRLPEFYQDCTQQLVDPLCLSGGSSGPSQTWSSRPIACNLNTTSQIISKLPKIQATHADIVIRNYLQELSIKEVIFMFTACLDIRIKLWLGSEG